MVVKAVMQKPLHDLCSKCKRNYLVTRDEIDVMLCKSCQDVAADAYNEAKDWQRWHND